MSIQCGVCGTYLTHTQAVSLGGLGCPNCKAIKDREDRWERLVEKQTEVFGRIVTVLEKILIELRHLR